MENTPKKKLATRAALRNVLRSNLNKAKEEKITGDPIKDANAGPLGALSNSSKYAARMAAEAAAKAAGKGLLTLLKFALPIALPLIIVIMFIFGTVGAMSGIVGGNSAIEAMESDSGEYDDSMFTVGPARSFSRLDANVQQGILDSLDGIDERIITAIRFALSHVGDAYSQEGRFGDNTFDCSSFAYRAYKEADIDISFQGSSTAAAECQGLEILGKNVPPVGDVVPLEPGDLIFYSYDTNNRYKNITHVAIYAGDGMILDARGVRYGVVYRTLATRGIVSVCRPVM